MKSRSNEKKRGGSVLSKPTPQLIEGAVHKALDGNKKCQAIVERWIVEHPAELIAALEREVSRKLGYEPNA